MRVCRSLLVKFAKKIVAIAIVEGQSGTITGDGSIESRLIIAPPQAGTGMGEHQDVRYRRTLSARYHHFAVSTHFSNFRS